VPDECACNCDCNYKCTCQDIIQRNLCRCFSVLLSSLLILHSFACTLTYPSTMSASQWPQPSPPLPTRRCRVDPFGVQTDAENPDLQIQCCDAL
jgi:hypothetical protein